MMGLNVMGELRSRLKNKKKTNEIVTEGVGTICHASNKMIMGRPGTKIKRKKKSVLRPFRDDDPEMAETW